MARSSKGNTSRREADDDSGDEPEVNGQNGSARSSSKKRGKEKARPEQEDGDEDVEEQEEMEENNEQRQDDPAYDPDQPVHEKRKVRKEYRYLTTKLQADRAQDIDGISADALKAGILNANAFFNNVKTPAEAVLDSNFLILTGDLAMHQARKLKIGGDYFDTDDFVSKMRSVISGGIMRGRKRKAQASASQQRRRRVGSDDEDEEDEQEDDMEDDLVPASQTAQGWESIGQLATKYTYRVPPIDFMLGPLAIPQKKKIQKKQRTRQEKMNPGDVVKPQELQREDIVTEEKGTTEYVMSIARVLEEAGGVDGMNLFNFIINPTSFAQTVENIFYTSFLVKDKRAAIDISDEGDPVIYACEPPDEEQRKDQDLVARQIIFEMDEQMWSDAIQAYDIKKPTIPTRKYAVYNPNEKRWHGAM